MREHIHHVKMPIKVGKYVKLMPVDCEPPATWGVIKEGNKIKVSEQRDKFSPQMMRHAQQPRLFIDCLCAIQRLRDVLTVKINFMSCLCFLMQILDLFLEFFEKMQQPKKIFFDKLSESLKKASTMSLRNPALLSIHSQKNQC